MTTDLLFEEINGQGGALGQVTLNRPQALNALTHEMAIALDKQLTAWAAASHIKAIVIRAAGSRAFCAGGDIRHIYDAGKAGDLSIRQFFWDEYCLNRRIYHYPKPYIALLDGITMGGGVGISVHGSHRIATENLTFAMPETGIGFIPDVGGSYFLPRCPGKLGIYLGLTGARLKAADACYAGVTDHYVPSARLDDLIASLAQTPFAGDARRAVTQLLDEFSNKPDEAPLAAHRAAIDHCFAASSVPDILQTLRKNENAWCHDTAKTIASKSPISLAVTLQLMQRGSALEFDQCMKMEYRVVNRFLKEHDFYEGVRALLIDKDQKPQWDPADVSAITPAKVEGYFAPFAEELVF